MHDLDTLEERISSLEKQVESLMEQAHDPDHEERGAMELPVLRGKLTTVTRERDEAMAEARAEVGNEIEAELVTLREERDLRIRERDKALAQLHDHALRPGFTAEYLQAKEEVSRRLDERNKALEAVNSLQAQLNEACRERDGHHVALVDSRRTVIGLVEERDLRIRERDEALARLELERKQYSGAQKLLRKLHDEAMSEAREEVGDETEAKLSSLRDLLATIERLTHPSAWHHRRSDSGMTAIWEALKKAGLAKPYTKEDEGE